MQVELLSDAGYPSELSGANDRQVSVPAGSALLAFFLASATSVLVLETKHSLTPSD